MTTERIDVLAVFDAELGIGTGASLEEIKLARAAVAELIEKSNAVAYAFSSDTGDHIHGFCLGVDEVRDLRAALARIGGAK